MHFTAVELLNLVRTYGYIILFPLVLVEGLVIVVVAGMLISAGVLNPVPTFLIIVLGNLLGDMVYYAIGRWWIRGAIEKISSFLKIKESGVRKLENRIRKSGPQLIIFGKISNVAVMPVLVTAGTIKFPLKKYIWYCFLAEAPKSLVLMLVGYYFGNAIIRSTKYLDEGVWAFFISALILVIIYVALRRFFGKIVIALEK